MSNLANPGYNYKFIPEETRRFIFCLTHKTDGTENYITLADAVTLANWQTLFNTYNFASDPAIKFICSPMVFGVTPEQAESKAFDENNYFRKLADGDYDVSAMLYDVCPSTIAALKDLENYNVSVYMVTTETQVQGRSDGTNLIPIKIQNTDVQDYKITSSDGVSQVVMKFRLKTANEMNSLVAVTIASADVTSDVDFFSLRDVTGTVDTPAVTGCNVILALDDLNPSDPSTAIYLTDSLIAFGDITFTDQADDSDVTLADGDSLSYDSATKKHTINEAALLTAGHTYTLKVSESGYDVTCGDVVVPA